MTLSIYLNVIEFAGDEGFVAFNHPAIAIAPRSNPTGNNTLRNRIKYPAPLT